MDDHSQTLHHLDKDQLVSLILDKDRRVRDLERMVDEQKRLRLQDSSQVEEKAAKIKEWVTKKLKELENQNKLLRDQNRKQKEAVETLNIKLASMSPVSSPMKHQNINYNGNNINNNDSDTIPDGVDFIDQHNTTSNQGSPNQLDPEKRIRRPTLKHKHPLLNYQFHSNHNSGNSNNSNIFITTGVENNQEKLYIHLDNASPVGSVPYHAINIDKSSSMKNFNSPTKRNTGISLVSINQSNQTYTTNTPPIALQHHNPSSKSGKESPLYDTVHIDPPPPRPLHQSDRWERQLYDLADRTFSSLTSDLEACLKPAFTTIDGDQVVDDAEEGEVNELAQDNEKSRSHRNDDINRNINENHRSKNNDRNSNEVHPNDGNNNVHYSTLGRPKLIDSSQHRNSSYNLFSPMRSRTNKDSILRTQSVKKAPAPEKLYDFISADLVKRGYLTKQGALRSHQRWIVLKQFHLFIYKKDSDEMNKQNPSLTIKLDPQIQLQILGHNNDGYSFKISYHDKQSLVLLAETAQIRDEWIKILTVAINMSDIEPQNLTKQNSAHESLVVVTRQGLTKKCHAVLIKHIVFFLKSFIDPTPLSYVSLKNARVREVTDTQDYDTLEQEFNSDNGENKSDQLNDCALAIYPRYSLNLDPVYIGLANQQETDEWFHHLSTATGLDQSCGTKFERTLTQLMLNKTVTSRKNSTNSQSFSGISTAGDGCGSTGGASDTSSVESSGCLWRDNTAMLYSDKPIVEPLTSLPNETLKSEAIEMFKSVLLFTQVPIEPVAIDYHICLLQNSLGRFLKYRELRNEFYAQLIKQSSYIRHRCYESKLSASSSSSGCSSINQRSSLGSLSPVTSDCHLVSDLQMLNSIQNDRDFKHETHSIVSHATNSHKDRNESSPIPEEQPAPSSSGLLQVIQIICLAASLNLPRGRMRWWLSYHLKKFAKSDTEIGKYALFALKAIERTLANGSRDNVPSRTEIMSILLRNPYDHSTPHSLPVYFSDGTYMIVGIDGSTTVEEFMLSMNKQVNVRASELSDFYLFADDPHDTKNTLHILEPQRKILDVVSWWEQTFRQQNSGRNQNTRVIRIYCKKRLVFKTEDGETEQEKVFVVHQINQEVALNKIPLSEALVIELGAIMIQLTYGDAKNYRDDPKKFQGALEKVATSYLPQSDDTQTKGKLASRILDRWPTLTGRSAQDCVRVYLRCVRKVTL